MDTLNQPASAGPITIAYTDGACLGNPGPGAWAYRLENPTGTITEAAGFLPATTNNRAELLAAISALEATPEGSQIHLYSDSQYVVGGASQWLEGWKERSWRNASKKPVKNKELWQRLDALMAPRQATFEHIPGHSGIPGNERADEMAQEAAGMGMDFAPITVPATPL